MSLKMIQQIASESRGCRSAYWSIVEMQLAAGGAVDEDVAREVLGDQWGSVRPFLSEQPGGGIAFTWLARAQQTADKRRKNGLKGGRKKPSVNHQRTISEPSANHEVPVLTGRAGMVNEVYQHWGTYHPGAAGRQLRATSKIYKAIDARLKEGHTVAELQEAIDGCHHTPHNLGQNERGTQYLSLELICRDDANVDRFRENMRQHREGGPVLGQQTQRTLSAVDEWRRQQNQSEAIDVDGAGARPSGGDAGVDRRGASA